MKLTSDVTNSLRDTSATRRLIAVVTNQETRDGSGACDSGRGVRGGRGEAGEARTLQGNAPVSHCKGGTGVKGGKFQSC
jgi:hypothetical protein